MAHTEEILVHGVMTPVTVFDSAAQEIDNAAQAAKYGGGINLLDNWYFAGPIDQRQGYAVPPGTAYYSDTGLTTQTGTVSAYTTAVYVNGTYGTITVSGAACYVAWTAAVRGYAAGEDGIYFKYTIDRWRSWPTMAVCVMDGYLRVDCAVAYSVDLRFEQPLENPERFRGKTLTMSALLRGFSGGVDVGIRCHKKDGGFLSQNQTAVKAPGLVSCTYTIPEEAGEILPRVAFSMTAGGYAAGDYFEVCAAKLELGSTQTLARQDDNGNWVLSDPPPKPGAALAECQRYLQLYSSADKRPSLAVDCRPAMRIDPTPLTLSINGQTYYANSAEL